MNNTIIVTLENGSEFHFYNRSASTRSGFKHECLLIPAMTGRNYTEEKATCYYYNRTWEKFTFESVMLSALYNMEKGRKEYIKDNFKANKNISRVTKKYKDELQEYFCSDPIIKQITECRKLIDKETFVTKYNY